MSEYQTVTYQSANQVATVMLNRPNDLNAFNQALSRDLGAALRVAATDDEIRVVLLGGHGRAFSAGADLKSGMPSGQEVKRILQEEHKTALLAITQLDKPVISVVQGTAAGVGLSYALAADLVMMADDAFFLSPFANIGLVPDGGLSWLFTRTLGYQRAYQLAIECERIPASRCLELGLVNRLAPAADLMSQAQQWADSLAKRAPLALKLTKRAMRRAMEVSFGDTIDYEAELQVDCIESQDCREGIIAFLTKRPAQFTGR
jgi:2-(1,2-epoxy-1,2-dihydrophenyl)acetyl-CoA isomerase